MAIGAAMAVATACIQATGNALLFTRATDQFMVSFLYSLLYWFWFYFSWTTAYLALSYSITLQEQERQSAALRLQAQEAQNRALRYQINPHFLFNTLNAIAALVRDAPVKAEEMVVQLSDFFRRSLAVNPMEDVTLAQEVELQRLYLEIERTRFPDRLRFDVALEDGSAEAKVPALLLQPLVENAVKHGVARSEAPTCIGIRGRVDGAMLEIVVDNDAKAEGPRPAGEKVGLHNVAERLRSRFGEAASLTAGERAESGFRNIVRIPLRR
jgi:LytS/YehU family sensor histidine kinase